MQKVTVRGVYRTEPNGSTTVVGYLPAESPAPEGLTSHPMEMVDPEDETPTFWVLACCDRVPLLDTEALDALRDGELARQVKAKLTDAELTALGLTREDS